MATSSAERRTARGAAKMDAADPEWFKAIDKERLNLLSPDDCPVGQVFGYYWEDYDKVTSRLLAGYNGFYISIFRPAQQDADALKAAWIGEVDRRLASAETVN